jgi:hypothetical protein
MPGLLPILIPIHVALAVALLAPSVLLPFALRRRPSVAAASSGGRARRALTALQTHGTPVIGLGLALTGLGMLGSLGFDLLDRPWLLVALVIYGANLVLAFFVQRPALRALVGLRTADARADASTWAARARRQRYVSYAMAGLIGAIGFLMSMKPALW